MKDQRGSVEILAFLLILPLLLVPIFNGFYYFSDINKYDILKQVSREALLRMEITGGLTAQDYDRIISYLESKNFDVSNVQFDYTPYPVNFGEEVAVSISYTYEQVRFSLGLGGIQKMKNVEVMTYGPIKSISKHYER